MHLLISNLPLLSEQLKMRTDELWSRMIRTNYNTQFVQTASELIEFRRATAGFINRMEDDTLAELFRKTVQLTTYDSYAPFIARFFEKPCKESAIVDLLSPGLPDFLVVSSSTSGGLQKWFPKYNRLSQISSLVSDPLRNRTKATLRYLGYEKMNVEDEDNCPATAVYLCCGSAMAERMRLHLDPEKDEEKMAKFILDQAVPYAAGFIAKWRPFLLIHALFAVRSRSLETIHMAFITTLVDMMHYLDMEFDMVVDCIANGTIPDLDGIENVRHYLELNISPDPARAGELRDIGSPSSRPGWCGQVWPELRSITCIASGAFASSLPLARSFLGPSIDIRPLGYGCTEVMIGWPYSPLKLNQFKLLGDNIIEFLDISKSDSINSLTQIWEVQLGRRYEVVATTQDGLWRYRVGDVVEISGFDPTDGIPIIQYIKRRNEAIRFRTCMISEEELKIAMSSAIPNTVVKIVDWTATVDNRLLLPTIGFFVELYGDQVPNLPLATEHALNALSRSNEMVIYALEHESFRKPTIRLVQSGTFSGFRQLKLDECNRNIGQIKVPIVLPKIEYVAWFEHRVVQEL